MAQTAAEKARLAALAKQNAQAEAKARGLQFQANKAAAKKTRLAEEAAATAADPDATYAFTKVGTTGLTQGQIEAKANAASVAALTGGTVDPVTGYVKAPTTVSTTKFPKSGTILRYKPGSKSGTRIPVYADGAGGEFDGEESNDPTNPGSTGFTDTGTITLAKNTFANTLALLIGETEAGQPWVEELRELAQGFINTGSTTEEAINLALRDAKAKGKAGKFVTRFSAIFKLQDRLNAGETVTVPTIAEYVKSEEALGDVFRRVGLGELATQEMASKILGDANKSVAEATDLIMNVFSSIDNAPEVLKNDLKTYFPGADRTSIAKALLLGKEGALELTKKVKSIEQLSAAKSQGVGISLAEGADLAAMGADYGTSLGKFAEVKRLERGQSLGRMSNIDFTQQEAISSQFAGNAAADEKIRRIKEQEMNRFSGASGRLASQNRSRDF